MLLICLMLILPLQWSGAAAASICQHELASATPHIGHHAHQHVDADPAADGSGPGDDHADCVVCHFAAAAQACNDASLVLEVERTVEVRVAPSTPHYTSHIPDLPERPDRSATP